MCLLFNKHEIKFDFFLVFFQIFIIFTKRKFVNSEISIDLAISKLEQFW